MSEELFDIKKEVNTIAKEVVELRRDFHSYPELGYQEFRTSDKISEYLTELGIENEKIYKTGISAFIKGNGGSEKTVLLRADMDALQVTEKTGLPFASQNSGVMHACGHDGHIAIQLCVAKILSKHKGVLNGNVKLLFQPNEEEAGALDMITAGILENPKVDAAFALHLWSPIKFGRVGVSAGPVLGTTEEFELTIKGKAGHTAMPHEAKDALFGACQIVNQMQELISREFNPLWPVAVMFGKIQSGTSRNIVSGEAKLGGTIRFLFPDEKTNKPIVLAAFERIIKGICYSYNLSYEINYIPSNPSLYNDPALTSLVKENVQEVYGTTDNIDEFRSLAGEDFAEISQRVPSVMTFVGIYNVEKKSIYPHHHECFDIDEDALVQGVELQIRNVLSYLG